MSTAPGPPNSRDEVFEGVFPPHRVLSIVALLVAAFAGSAGYSYTRYVLEASSLSDADVASSSSDSGIVVARFAWLEGVVQVRHAGTHEWVNADPAMALHRFDQVRTGSAAAAEIRFWNGDVFEVRPHSLITIEEGAPPR